MRKTSLNSVYKLAQKDPRVVFIGSDLGSGTLNEMKSNMPERFFMEGVAEQHIIGMSAGLALEGFIPYVNTIATFLTRRCFEQIAIDLCLHDLPVRLIANGGGLVYAPLGPTHLAVEDIAILRTLPNMTIVAPCDADEMERLMSCTLSWPHPIYIRLGKGGDKVVSQSHHKFEIGKSIILKESSKAMFISTGVMTQLALEASEVLKEQGYNCGVMHMHTIKPLDTEALKFWGPKLKSIISIEEHSIIGGLGSSILEFFSDVIPEHTHKIKRIGLPDSFANKYGTQESLLNYMGINVNLLVNKMKKSLDI